MLLVLGLKIRKSSSKLLKTGLKAMTEFREKERRTQIKMRDRQAGRKTDKRT